MKKNKEGRVRMVDCKNQSFPAVLNQLPHRVKLNKKAKISEQKKFLAKEAGILGLGGSIRTIYVDKTTIAKLYEIATHFQIRILKSLNTSLDEEEMSFILNPENTVAFCDYCKYLGFDFSIDDENRKPYETPNLCELYKDFGPVSWVVVNYLKTNISRSQVESAFGIAVHCGTRREYEKYIHDNSNDDTVVTDCVDGYLQYTGYTILGFEPSKTAIDFLLNSAVPDRDKAHVSDLAQSSTQDMLEQMSC